MRSGVTEVSATKKVQSKSHVSLIVVVKVKRRILFIAIIHKECLSPPIQSCLLIVVEQNQLGMEFIRNFSGPSLVLVTSPYIPYKLKTKNKYQHKIKSTILKKLDYRKETAIINRYHFSAMKNTLLLEKLTGSEMFDLSSIN